MKQSKFPPGWNEKRIADVIAYYETQTEDEAVAEAEAALASEEQTIMAIPKELVPAVRELIARHTATVSPL
jgi:vacuolar-type H+-ATPase subunit F/Vma7